MGELKVHILRIILLEFENNKTEIETDENFL